MTHFEEIKYKSKSWKQEVKKKKTENIASKDPGEMEFVSSPLSDIWIESTWFPVTIQILLSPRVQAHDLSSLNTRMWKQA